MKGLKGGSPVLASVLLSFPLFPHGCPEAGAKGLKGIAPG